MNRILSLVSVAFIALATQSCNRYYYVNRPKARMFAASPEQSKKVQFYIDRDIELTREVDSANAKITEGKVVFQNGHYVNIVTLNKYTPGLCESAKSLNGRYSLFVSFEDGENKSLEFAIDESAKNNEVAVLVGKQTSPGQMKTMYEGQEYNVEYATLKHAHQKGSMSMYPSILIKQKIKETEEINVRKMKGKKVQ